MSQITVRELRSDLTFGSIVGGLTPDKLADPILRDELNALFEERGFILFEDVEPTAKFQVALSVALSKVFGPLKDHPTRSTPRDNQVDEDVLGVIDMHYSPDPAKSGPNQGIVEVNDKIVARFSPWHFDHCYNDELNRAGVLRSPISTPEGGRTGFLDGVDLYAQFSPELRARIERHNIIYTLDTRLSKMRFGVNFKVLGEEPLRDEFLKEIALFPRAMHPAVWTRRTGEKVLHIGPWMAFGIEHREDAQGEALFDAVCHEVNRIGATGSAYWHDWKPTDMVIWDNWRFLHAVEGCDPRHERHTVRTTIKGDYGLGYFENNAKIGEVYAEVA